MTIIVLCSNGHKLSAKESLAGKRIRCPKCGAVVRIPEKEVPPNDPWSKQSLAMPSSRRAKGLISDPSSPQEIGVGTSYRFSRRQILLITASGTITGLVCIGVVGWLLFVGDGNDKVATNNSSHPEDVAEFPSLKEPDSIPEMPSMTDSSAPLAVPAKAVEPATIVERPESLGPMTMRQIELAEFIKEAARSFNVQIAALICNDNESIGALLKNAAGGTILLHVKFVAGPQRLQQFFETQLAGDFTDIQFVKTAFRISVSVYRISQPSPSAEEAEEEKQGCDELLAGTRFDDMLVKARTEGPSGLFITKLGSFGRLKSDLATTDDSQLITTEFSR